MHILESIGAGIVSIALVIGGFFGYTPNIQESDDLGRAVNPVATNNYALAGSGISSSATTITLTSFTVPVTGVPYSMANFGEGVDAKGYLTIEPGSRARQETVSFTGITQNSDGSATLTGVSRGLLPFSPFTASTTYAVAHNGGAQVTVSNPPQLYDAIYDYIDNATTSGAVDGTVSAKGIYETATGLEAASTTAIGGGNTTATLALTTLISTSTSPTSGNVIPVTKADGNIDGSFIQNVEGATFTGTTTFTGTSTGIGKITTYSTAGTYTWTKATGTKIVEVHVFGGGGGGGGGSSDDSATLGSGGAGGGGGGYTFLKLTGVTTTVTVIAGAGGASGAGGAASNNNGVAGGTGGTSSFGSYAIALGGTGGAEGTVNGAGTDPVQGSGGAGLIWNGGGVCCLTTATGTAPLGGGVGGDSASGADGSAGSGRSTFFTQAGGAGGTGNVSDPGDAGVIPFNAIPTIGGSGGGGGESGIGITGGAGGAGINGSGGGGGGSSNVTGGAGGLGGSGYVVVIEW